MKVTHRPEPHHPVTQAPVQRLRFADFEVNIATREVWRTGVSVPLRRQVFDLLLMLIERRPRTVTRDELRQAMGERGTQAANAVARAVFEARRAIGDPQDQPRYIVNVHGVGYRFAGQPAQVLAPLPSITPLERARAHLRDAEAAYEQHNDMGLTRFHAEAALAEALHNGLNVESGNALCWLGWVAMWADSMQEAARHMGHALHLAEREGHALLLARARTADGYLRIGLGEFDRAMAQLTLAHPVLAEGGTAGDLYRCEHLLSVVARRLGTLDAARHWCLQAQRSAESGGLALARLRAVGAEALLDLEQGDLLDREGATDAATAAWQRALHQCERVLEQTDSALDPWLHAGMMGSRGTLLGRLRRYVEARDAFQAMEGFLGQHPLRDTPPMIDRRMMLQVYRSRISLLEGDYVAAMRHVENGLAMAEARGYRGQWRPDLYELGSHIAEHCGQIDRALRWSREHLAAQTALQGDRARAMAQAMQAQSQLEGLRTELESARREVLLLESLNAELLRRLHAGSGSHMSMTQRIGDAM